MNPGIFRRTAVPDFIGGDPESNASECPAVFVIPETGDFVFRGKTITDPALIAELNEHIGKAEDESDVWLPARMAPLIRDALDGYEQGREGPGQHTFAELLAATQASVIRFEMRDSYDETEQGVRRLVAVGCCCQRLVMFPISEVSPAPCEQTLCASGGTCLLRGLRVTV